MPDRTLTLKLPFASPSQNALQRWHWSRRAELRDKAALLLRLQANVAGFELPVRGKVRLHVERCGPRTLDFGNLVGGCKPVLDALVREGFLVDDSPKWLEDTYTQGPFTRAPGRTIFTLQELPP